MSEHAIAAEYRAALIRDLYRREVTDRYDEIQEHAFSALGCFRRPVMIDFMYGWAIAKGLTIAEASDFARSPQHAAPTVNRRLL
jgi:hypothetical protein